MRLENRLRIPGRRRTLVGENHDNTLAHTRVVAYLVNGAGFDNALQAIEEAGAALKLKKVDVELSLEEFVCLFKR